MTRDALLKKRSAAVTLSDMEIFIFPELMYSLVLANLMSPRIWAWRDNPWFDGLASMKPYKRMTRVKQYIMDHYAFNLDLDTWGLTKSDEEMARFADVIAPETLAQSNALFGYEGDKYYFDIDIRTHFGLDKYTSDVIPYWKTETVEAMDAFRHLDDYQHGAGECVSLAALYAAALYIVAEIPLDDIYLMATPLHSQNFIDLDDGVLTNNRRLVTKNMWCNGTALSAQGRRALENEKVTIVTHATGHIHTIYDDYTMDPAAYSRFSDRLENYLKTPLNTQILGNFLRQCGGSQNCFQIRHQQHGNDYYIGLDKAFSYENGSPYKMTDKTRKKLMAEVSLEDFECKPLERRIVLNDLETFVKDRKIDLDDPADVEAMRTQFGSGCLNASMAVDKLIDFCHVKPQLPELATKQRNAIAAPLALTQTMDRAAVIEHLDSIREGNPVVDLAFHAYRDLIRCEPTPYLIASTERNPVSVEATRTLSATAVAEQLASWPDDSIYDDEGRLAQPDEVWNFGRGDGLEKAVTLANVMLGQGVGELTVTIEGAGVTVAGGEESHTFQSTKNLPSQTWTLPIG
jgi:hypothetical protein